MKSTTSSFGKIVARLIYVCVSIAFLYFFVSFHNEIYHLVASIYTKTLTNLVINAPDGSACLSSNGILWANVILPALAGLAGILTEVSPSVWTEKGLV